MLPRQRAVPLEHFQTVQIIEGNLSLCISSLNNEILLRQINPVDKIKCFILSVSNVCRLTALHVFFFLYETGESRVTQERHKGKSFAHWL